MWPRPLRPLRSLFASQVVSPQGPSEVAENSSGQDNPAREGIVRNVVTGAHDVREDDLNADVQNYVAYPHLDISATASRQVEEHQTDDVEPLQQQQPARAWAQARANDISHLVNAVPEEWPRREEYPGVDATLPDTHVASRADSMYMRAVEITEEDAHTAYNYDLTRARDSSAPDPDSPPHMEALVASASSTHAHALNHVTGRTPRTLSRSLRLPPLPTQPLSPTSRLGGRSALVHAPNGQNRPRGSFATSRGLQEDRSHGSIDAGSRSVSSRSSSSSVAREIHDYAV
jgi:hypothetical protein